MLKSPQFNIQVHCLYVCPLPNSTTQFSQVFCHSVMKTAFPPVFKICSSFSSEISSEAPLTSVFLLTFYSLWYMYLLRWENLFSTMLFTFFWTHNRITFNIQCRTFLPCTSKFFQPLHILNSKPNSTYSGMYCNTTLSSTKICVSFLGLPKQVTTNLLA